MIIVDLVVLADDQLLGQLCRLLLVVTAQMIGLATADALCNCHGITGNRALVAVVQRASETSVVGVDELEQRLALDAA